MKHLVRRLRKQAADVDVRLAVLVLQGTVERLDGRARRRNGTRNGRLLDEKLLYLRRNGLGDRGLVDLRDVKGTEMRGRRRAAARVDGVGRAVHVDVWLVGGMGARVRGTRQVLLRGRDGVAARGDEGRLGRRDARVPVVGNGTVVVHHVVSVLEGVGRKVVVQRSLHAGRVRKSVVVVGESRNHLRRLLVHHRVLTMLHVRRDRDTELRGRGRNVRALGVAEGRVVHVHAGEALGQRSQTRVSNQTVIWQDTGMSGVQERRTVSLALVGAVHGSTVAKVGWVVAAEVALALRLDVGEGRHCCRLEHDVSLNVDENRGEGIWRRVFEGAEAEAERMGWK